MAHVKTILTQTTKTMNEDGGETYDLVDDTPEDGSIEPWACPVTDVKELDELQFVSRTTPSIKRQE